MDWASATGGGEKYSAITGTKEDTNVDLSCCASCFFMRKQTSKYLRHRNILAGFFRNWKNIIYSIRYVTNSETTLTWLYICCNSHKFMINYNISKFLNQEIVYKKQSFICLLYLDTLCYTKLRFWLTRHHPGQQFVCVWLWHL